MLEGHDIVKQLREKAVLILSPKDVVTILFAYLMNYLGLSRRPNISLYGKSICIINQISLSTSNRLHCWRAWPWFGNVRTSSTLLGDWIVLLDKEPSIDHKGKPLILLLLVVAKEYWPIPKGLVYCYDLNLSDKISMKFSYRTLFILY